MCSTRSLFKSVRDPWPGQPLRKIPAAVLLLGRSERILGVFDISVLTEYIEGFPLSHDLCCLSVVAASATNPGVILMGDLILR